MQVPMLGDLLDRRFFARVKAKHTEPLRLLFAKHTQRIHEHVKPSADPRACDEYDICISFGRSRGPRTPFPEIYWDTQLGFVLTATSEPDSAIACVGFGIHHDWLGVTQIQGVEGKQEFLRPLKWEQLLLRTAVEYGRILGLKHVVVPPSERHPYNPLHNDEFRSLAKLSEDECRARATRLYLAYDKTAQRCGFTYNGRWRAYSLAL